MGYWVDDPNGQNPPRYVEGFDPSQGQSVEGPGVHTSKKKLLWQQGKYFLVPLSVGIADAALGGYGAAQALGVSPVGATTGGTTIGLTAPSAAAATGAPLTAAVTGAGTAAGASTAATAGVGTGAGAGTVGTTAAGTGIGTRLLNAALNQGPTLLQDVSKGLADKANTDAVNRQVGTENESEFNKQKVADKANEINAAQLDLQRREFQGKDYQRNFSNSIRGDLLANMQDFNVKAPPGIPMGEISGGLSLEALPHRQEYGDAARQTAMYNMLHPQEMPPLPGPTDLTAPANPQQGGASKSAGLSLGLNIGSRLLGGYLNSRTPAPATVPASSQIYAPPSDFMSRNNATFLPPYRRT